MDPCIKFNRTKCTFDVRDGTITHDAGLMSDNTCKCPNDEIILFARYSDLFDTKTREFKEQDKTRTNALNRHILNQIQQNVDRVQINDDLWNYAEIPHQYRDQYNIVRENIFYSRVDEFGELVQHMDRSIICLKKKTYVNPPNVFDVMWKYSL